MTADPDIRVDHVILGAPSLEMGLDAVESHLGVRPEVGGVHPEFGTQNAILSLGGSVYLEVLAPADTRSSGPCLFGLDRLASPALVTWVARTSRLERVLDDAARLGYDLAPVRGGFRLRPDGRRVSWRATRPDAFPEHGVIPFFIDWGDSEHPGSAAALGTFSSLWVAHPDADRITDVFRRIGLDIPVRRASRPAIGVGIRVRDRLVEFT